MSTTSSPRKRKRSALEASSESVPGTPTEGVAEIVPSTSSLSPLLTPPRAGSQHPAEGVQPNAVKDSGGESARRTLSRKQKSKAGKRKGKKLPVDPGGSEDVAIHVQEEQDEIEENGGAAFSNGEDGEREDVGDVDLDNANRDEAGCEYTVTQLHSGYYLFIV